MTDGNLFGGSGMTTGDVDINFVNSLNIYFLFLLGVSVNS